MGGRRLRVGRGASVRDILGKEEGIIGGKGASVDMDEVYDHKTRTKM